MIIEIFDLPHMPLNRAKMLTVVKRRPMLIKTPLCREFEKDVEQRLKKYADDFCNFANSESRIGGYVVVEYNIFVPHDTLFTKAGEISSRAADIDGFKVFQDALFKAIGIDDKYIREATYRSLISHDGNWNYRISLNWRKIECLKSMYSQTQSITEPMNKTSESFALL